MVFALLHDSIEVSWDCGCIEAEFKFCDRSLHTMCLNLLQPTMSLNLRRSWRRGVSVLRISDQLFLLCVP